MTTTYTTTFELPKAEPDIDTDWPEKINQAFDDVDEALTAEHSHDAGAARHGGSKRMRIQVVADAAALTALTGMLEGDLVFQSDDDSVWVYDGSAWDQVNAGGGGTVDSVFGRTGTVAAAASDYDASQIDNDSSVSGATVAAALNALLSALSGYQPTDSDLTALAALASTGLIKRTGAGTWEFAVAGTDYAAASHNQAASTITSGQLAVARGGTGQDFSASSGIVKLTTGTMSAVTAPSGTIVGTIDTQVLSNKTLTTPALSLLNITPNPTITPDFTNGSFAFVQLTSNTSFNNFTNYPYVGEATLIVDLNSYEITGWGGLVRHAGGTMPKVKGTGLAVFKIHFYTSTAHVVEFLGIANTQSPTLYALEIAVGDESSDLTAGTAKVTFHAPFGMRLASILPRANVKTAPSGSTIIVDINEAGSSIFSTRLTIDSGENTSVLAATPCVVSDDVIADDAEITIDIDQVGSSTAGKGLKVTLYFYRLSS